MNLRKSKKNKIIDLYFVLISSNLRLPWKCENTWAEDDRIIDFNILFIVDWVGNCVDLPRLRTEEGNDQALCCKGKDGGSMCYTLTSSTTALKEASMTVKPSFNALTRWYDPFWEDFCVSKYSEGKPVSMRTFWMDKNFIICGNN